MFSFDTEEPIFKLAAEGNLVELKNKILEQPERLHAKASNGSNLLMFAAESGHIETVQWLQQQGISLAEKGVSGKTALLFAAGNGSTKAVKWLLDNGASLEEKDDDGYTALFLATRNGKYEVVKYLLGVGAAPSEQKQFWLYSAANARYPIIRFLLEQINGQGKLPSLETLSQKIVAPVSVALVLPYLSPEQIINFITIMREKAPTLIEKMSAGDFRKIWDFTGVEQKQAIITAMGEQAIQIIATLKTSYFNSVVDMMTPEQKRAGRTAEQHRKAIVSELRKTSLAQPMSLEEAKEQVSKTGKSILHTVANDVMFLTYPEQSTVKQEMLTRVMIREPLNYGTFETTLNHLHGLGINLFNAIHSAKTPAEFGVILRDYAPEQMTQIPQEINRLSGLINTQDDLRRILRNLEPKQINVLCGMLGESLLKVTGSIEKYCVILGRLNSEQTGAFIESRIEHLSALIKTTDDYDKICEYLTNQQKAWLARSLHVEDPELLSAINLSIEQDAEHPATVRTHGFFSLPQKPASPSTEITADENPSTNPPEIKGSGSH
ncbi:ankyrin repeat domain-containing protein [Legionella shakespearei]|uniref:Phosphocholine transferase AnkX n=2 Tax=Legionella shakespearei TaxID=45075 RepID=A0A0W0Z007_9GAMM|nr:ankyrin repeat domain-containing protein [Legionella shakespearei]KTD62460.1 Phosphocholine transferase AnkX [Legionella shakespearei DSM 23087]